MSSVAATDPTFTSDALNAGPYRLQWNPAYGIVVSREAESRAPTALPRLTPIYLRPHKIVSLAGREAELHEVLSAIHAGAPVQCYGESGIGKTTLLRHLAYFPPDMAFPDGIVYLTARRLPLPDLLQALHDAFYTDAPQVKPTATDIRLALRHRRALFLLDDVDYEREDVEALLDVAPRSAWILSSHAATLEGVGRAVALRGLSLEAALSLMERELERPLTPEEHHAARELYQRLAGHPLRIVQAAARARDEGLPLDKLPLPEPDAAPALTAWATGVAQLPDAQRQILTLLAALGGAALPVEHLTALTQTATAQGAVAKGPAASVSPLDVLAALQQRGLAQSHSPRYSVPAELLPLLPKLWPSDVAAWESALLRHFADWAETPERTPERVLAAWEAIGEILQTGVARALWDDVLRLARAIEGDLARAKQWGAWRETLDAALQAARALGDRAAEAWALHQLGTRAGCLAAPEAREWLTQAAHLRESLGDVAGAAITRGNFQTFFGVLPPPLPKNPARPPLPHLAPWIVSVVAVVALLIYGGLALRRPPLPAATGTPPATITAAPSVTPAPTAPPASPPPPATPTLPPSPTPTPTATAPATAPPTPTAPRPPPGAGGGGGGRGGGGGGGGRLRREGGGRGRGRGRRGGARLDGRDCRNSRGPRRGQFQVEPHAPGGLGLLLGRLVL